MSGRDDKAPVPHQGRTGSPVDAFLDKAASVAPKGPRRGRLIFALDATMSRQPTWDLAQQLQGRMFDTAAILGGLDVQLVYFRGFGECRASSFVAGGEGLARLMSRIQVQGGQTQIGKVLRHARDEARTAPVAVMVFVGDAMEENPDDLAAVAGELGLLGVKAFMFQEGRDTRTELVFKDLARLTGGVHAHFDSSAPERLAALLSAAAAYAAGGRPALEKHGGPAASRLLTQMR
ncbi:MAG: VWA domain-containing protein [Beijerinckiaceae bacterium]|jgi:hypothetical protein|nr:VWA domain-containing protein [Beijerinckiaceae bacterium]